MTDEGKIAVQKLYEIAESIYDQLDTGKIPKMVIPLRTKIEHPLRPEALRLEVRQYARVPGRRRRRRAR